MVKPPWMTRNGHDRFFRYEFLALKPDPRAVTEAIREYPLGLTDKFILDVFHASPSEPELKAKYQSLGYDFVRTGPILGRDLPTQHLRNDVTHICPARTGWRSGQGCSQRK